jgi:hypothetical protein
MLLQINSRIFIVNAKESIIGNIEKVGDKGGVGKFAEETVIWTACPLTVSGNYGIICGR